MNKAAKFLNLHISSGQFFGEGQYAVLGKIFGVTKHVNSLKKVFLPFCSIDGLN